MTLKWKINFSIVLIIILAILIIFFGIIPVFKDINNYSEEFIFQKQMLASLENKIKNLDQLKPSYDNYKLSIEKIDGLFIDLEIPVDFVGFLESLAKKNNIKIKISPAPSEKQKNTEWSSINFQIVADGSFQDFLRFLNKIESAPYLINIKNFDISATENEGIIKSSFLTTVFAK